MQIPFQPWLYLGKYLLLLGSIAASSLDHFFCFCWNWCHSIQTPTRVPLWKRCMDHPCLLPRRSVISSYNRSLFAFVWYSPPTYLFGSTFQGFSAVGVKVLVCRTKSLNPIYQRPYEIVGWGIVIANNLHIVLFDLSRNDGKKLHFTWFVARTTPRARRQSQIFDRSFWLMWVWCITDLNPRTLT